MQYYTKLDDTKHIANIFLTSQVEDPTDYTQVTVPDTWEDLFMKDWTNFYIKDDGSMDFDNNKSTQTQQQIDKLTANLTQAQASINQLMILSAKGAK